MMTKRLIRRNLMSAAACLCLAGPALAAEPDQAGADKIRQGIEHYLGKKAFDNGTLSITISGDAYELKIDPKAALPIIPRLADITFAPFVYRLKAMDDGRYGVTFDQSVSFSYTLEGPTGPLKNTGTIDRCRSDGVYDPKMLAFATMKAKCEAYHITQTGPEADADITVKGLAIDITGASVSDGKSDTHVVEAIESLVEDINFKDPKMPFNKVVATADNIGATIDLHGFANRPFLDLLALVLNQGDAPPSADAVKAALVSLLPLWDDNRADVKIGAMSVDMPMGTVRLKNVTEGINMSGLTKSAAGTVAFGYEGLELPSIVPDWTKTLIPTQGRIEFGVKDIDADGLARLAIAKYDPSQKPPIPAEAQTDFLNILMATSPHFLINPSSLAANGIDVKFEGDMSMFPTQAGKFTISSNGLDQVQMALTNSDMPNKDKAALGISFVKGLAKSGADGRLVWEVEFDVAQKKLIVNGMPLPH